MSRDVTDTTVLIFNWIVIFTVCWILDSRKFKYTYMYRV